MCILPGRSFQGHVKQHENGSLTEKIPERVQTAAGPKVANCPERQLLCILMHTRKLSRFDGSNSCQNALTLKLQCARVNKDSRALFMLQHSESFLLFVLGFQTAFCFNIIGFLDFFSSGPRCAQRNRCLLGICCFLCVIVEGRPGEEVCVVAV